MDPNVMSIEHFDVQRVVGQGGFGKVNCAVRNTTNEWFAIKKLMKKPVLANDRFVLGHSKTTRRISPRHSRDETVVYAV